MFKSLKTITAIAVAAAALGGATQASAATSFGADVKPDVQPSNSSQPHECNGYPGKKCTWVLNDAYGNPGHEKSPKSGTLKKIKLIAGAPGSFKLQLVKVSKADQSAKLVTNGPKISYEGQEDPNADTYDVESFKVDMKIHKGEQLAIATKETSTLRCSSGGPNTLLYNPVLQYDDDPQVLGSADGCWMLIEGFVK